MRTVHAPQTPCSQPTCVPVAPSSPRRNSLSSIFVSASPSVNLPFKIIEIRWRVRLGSSAIEHLLDNSFPNSTDDLAAIARSGVDVVRAAQLPCKIIESAFEFITLRAL